MKLVYIVLGSIAVLFGVMSWCGYEMTNFAAGCFAITAGTMFISEVDKVK